MRVCAAAHSMHASAWGSCPCGGAAAGGAPACEAARACMRVSPELGSVAMKAWILPPTGLSSSTHAWGGGMEGGGRCEEGGARPGRARGAGALRCGPARRAPRARASAPHLDGGDAAALRAVRRVGKHAGDAAGVRGGGSPQGRSAKKVHRGSRRSRRPAERHMRQPCEGAATLLWYHTAARNTRPTCAAGADGWALPRQPHSFRTHTYTMHNNHATHHRTIRPTCAAGLPAAPCSPPAWTAWPRGGVSTWGGGECDEG